MSNWARVTFILFAIHSYCWAQEDLVVIVNRENPVRELTKKDLAKIFLKRTKNWPDGALIVPVDQHAGSEVRTVFSQTILDRSTSAVRIYWQQQIFSGRDISPAEYRNETEIVDFVEKNRNAIGYVSPTTQIGSTKKVRVTEL